MKRQIFALVIFFMSAVAAAQTPPRSVGKDLMVKDLADLAGTRLPTIST